MGPARQGFVGHSAHGARVTAVRAHGQPDQVKRIRPALTLSSPSLSSSLSCAPPSPMATAAKLGDGGHSTGGGGRGDGGGEFSEVDHWLGSGSFATKPAAPPPPQRTPQAAALMQAPTPQATPPSPDDCQFSLEYRAARSLASAVQADPANSQHWASAFEGVE